MDERINQGNEEGGEKPHIQSVRIKELSRISVVTGIPLNVLVDTALREFVSGYVNDPRYQTLLEQEAKEEARWRRENEIDESFDEESGDKMYPDPYEFEP